MKLHAEPSIATWRAARYRGLTLLEMLIALALTGFVVTTAGHLAVQALHTERHVSKKMVMSLRATHLLGSISEDVASSFEPAALQLDPNHRPAIHLTCLSPQPTGELHVARSPSLVVYRLARQDRAGSLRLERVRTSLTAPQRPPRVTTIATDVASFDVEVWLDKQWQPLGGKSATQNPIAAFRVSCRFKGHGTEVSRVYLTTPVDSEG